MITLAWWEEGCVTNPLLLWGLMQQSMETEAPTLYVKWDEGRVVCVLVCDGKAGVVTGLLESCSLLLISVKSIWVLV